MPALIILAIIAITTLLIASYEFMKYILISFIILGLVLDITDFIFRMIKYLRRKKVPSAIPVVGFLLVVIGLLGFAARDTITWKAFFLLLPLALVLHLAIQVLLPLMTSMVCNIIFGRRLFDHAPLPEMKKS